MADLRKESGGIKGRNLLITVNPKADDVKTKTGGQISFLDVQLNQTDMKLGDMRSGEAKADPNPHVMSVEKPQLSGEGTFVDHTNIYPKTTVDKIKEQAEKDGNMLTLDDGVTVMAVKADLMILGGKEGVKLNPKTLETSDIKLTPKALDKQRSVKAEAKELRDAAKENTAKETPANSKGKEAEAEMEM